MQTLVTGATGFLGSHIVERLLARGDSVRALVRETSDTTFLKSRGVDLAVGDITEPATLPAALKDVDIVYHAAANVSDWGPYSDFKRITIRGTRNMLRASANAGVKRFLHVSSDAVYRFDDLREGVDEDTRVETNFGPLDYYRKSKTKAEKVARKAHRDGLIPVTIVRPALILGDRDSTMLPGLLVFLKSPTASYIGSAKNQLPIVYAGDVAELCILAAASDDSAGEIYNAVNEEYVTQRDFFIAAAEEACLNPPKRSIPMRAIYTMAAGMEAAARLRGWSHRPDLTRFAVNLLGVDYVESNEKARSQLGWRAEVDMREAVRRSVEWARSRKRSSDSS